MAMNLVNEISKELSTQMQSEMDFEILSNMLVQSCGWHKVNLLRFKDRYHAVDIKNWLLDNAKGNWECRGSYFVFEDAGDAVNFTLKWR